MKPKGGTELQHAFLEEHVDKKLLDNFQICTSIPGKVPLSSDKINIMWQKNSFNQKNLNAWFSNKSNHEKYDWYIFNSHWNYEKFRYAFDLPTERCHVIKNGVVNCNDKYGERQVYKKGDLVRLVFQPTPWRGLNVLLAAMQYLKDENVLLDVYSSCEVYGDDFKKANDSKWVPLYEQANKLKNVNYIGYRPNDFILKKMPFYHLFAYPSIFEETSCISALECRAAGVYCIVTNYGALYETCSEFPVYVTFETDYNKLAYSFAMAIKGAINSLHEDYIQEHLQVQRNFVNRFYSWDKKGMEWNSFLQGALNGKRPK